MQLLNETSGVGVGDRRYRYKLKERLIKKYTDYIIFITIDIQNPQVVISVAAITGGIPVPELIGMDDDVLLKKEAFLLRQNILAFVDKVPSLPWPPAVDTLLGSEGRPPEEVTSFISHVLTSTKHRESHQITQLPKSFSEDLIHGVTCGKFLTAKHALVGVVLHNMTSQKVPVNILFRLGNSCSYDQVCEIETGLAELSHYFQAEGQ